MAHQRVRVGDHIARDNYDSLSIAAIKLLIFIRTLYTSLSIYALIHRRRCTKNTLRQYNALLCITRSERRQIDRSVFGLLLCCGARNVLCKFYGAHIYVHTERIKANLQLRVMELAERFVFNLKRMYRLISNLLNAPFTLKLNCDAD